MEDMTTKFEEQLVKYKDMTIDYEIMRLSKFMIIIFVVNDFIAKHFMTKFVK